MASGPVVSWFLSEKRAQEIHGYPWKDRKARGKDSIGRFSAINLFKGVIIVAHSVKCLLSWDSQLTFPFPDNVELVWTELTRIIVHE